MELKLNSIKERALQLLAYNSTPTQTAHAIGCSPAYISQLLADEAFMQELATLRMEYLSKKLERDQRMDEAKDSIEDKLLQKLTESIEYMHKPQDILLAIKVMNSLKRVAPQGQMANEASTQTVRLSLPAHLLQRTKVQIQLSPSNEILAAQDSEFLSPKSPQLLQMLPPSGGLSSSDPNSFEGLIP